MEKYNFFYDESEHSRKINHKTIEADNYYDDFISAIVGWRANDDSKLAERFSVFEKKYESRKSKGELKSTTIKQGQFENGFASLNKVNTFLLEDLLALFDEKTVIYFSVASKMEYLIEQVFEDYESSLFVNMDFMKYSITKAIVLYQPKEIMEGLYGDTGELVALLRNFFSARIEKNTANELLKQREIQTFTQILILLDSVKAIKTINWDYGVSFRGFKRFLAEIGVEDYSLVIDKEGNTAKAAE